MLSIPGFIIIWPNWLPLWPIHTGPCGKAKPSNIVPLVALILENYIHLAKWLVLHTILLSINQYSHTTAQYSPMVFLFMNLSVIQQKESVITTLTHPVLLFLVCHIPPSIHCIDCYWLRLRQFLVLCVGAINMWKFDEKLRSCSSALSGCSMWLPSCMSDLLYASQLS